MAASDETGRPVLSATGDSHSLWQWPAKPARLIGRSVELMRLHGLLDAHRRVLICGPKGIGKRTLVCAYGHRFSVEYQQKRLSLRFTTPSRLLAQPPPPWDAGLVAVSDDDAAQDAADADFADHLPALVRTAPLARLLIVGSSAALHKTATTLGFATLTVPPLSVEDGVALLIAHSGRHSVPAAEKRAAARLVEALCGVPARLLHMADLAHAQALPWSECLRRHLI